MESIEKSRQVRAPIEAVWTALTDPTALAAWMGEDEDLAADLKPGGEYRFFGAATTGAFTEIRRPNHLAYTWRQKAWDPAWDDSLVEWDLSRSAGGTSLQLRHTGFPNAQERDSHEEGWEVYFLGPMQAWLESRA